MTLQRGCKDHALLRLPRSARRPGLRTWYPDREPGEELPPVRRPTAGQSSQGPGSTRRILPDSAPGFGQG